MQWLSEHLVDPFHVTSCSFCQSHFATSAHKPLQPHSPGLNLILHLQQPCIRLGAGVQQDFLSVWRYWARGCSRRVESSRAMYGRQEVPGAGRSCAKSAKHRNPCILRNCTKIKRRQRKIGMMTRPCVLRQCSSSSFSSASQAR